MSDKTEAPTPRRLRKAREDGESPVSSFASQSLAFVAAIAVVPAAIAALSSRATELLRAAIAVVATPTPRIDFAPATLAAIIVALISPVLLVAGLTGAVSTFIQTGGVFSFVKLAPKLERLDPVPGLANLFSPTRLVAIARAALFVVGTTWAVRAALVDHAADLARSTGDLASATKVAAILALGVVRRVAAIGLALAVLDVVVSRRAFTKKLMMTKVEVDRERKETEGDPRLKAARERAHHEVLAAASLANVRTASVVVVNPTHLACALRWNDAEGDEAPVVVASGQGDLAAKIVLEARRHGVPVVRDVPLARALLELEIGTAIPEALYETVAEILREAWEGDA